MSYLRQDKSDLASLYAEAGRAMRELAALTRHLAHDVGAEAHVPLLKSLSRAREKVESDYLGDPAGLTDIARTAIICESFQDVREAVRRLGAEAELLRVKDRFAQPSAMGYRDFTANLRMSNGHIVELKIHLRPLFEADREEGHFCYEQVRSLDSSAQDRPLTEAERETRQGWVEMSRRLFDSVAARAGVGHNPGVFDDAAAAEARAATARERDAARPRPSRPQP